MRSFIAIFCVFIVLCASAEALAEKPEKRFSFHDIKTLTDMQAYIQEHSDASFSHGVCPDCLKTYYADVVNQMKVNDSGS